MIRPAGVPEPAGDDAEAFDLADLVFDANPEPAEAGVVFLLLPGEFTAFGFLAGMAGPFMVLAISLIRAVPVARALLGSFGPSRRTAMSWRLPGWDGETLAMRPFSVTISPVFSIWRFFLPE